MIIAATIKFRRIYEPYRCIQSKIHKSEQCGVKLDKSTHDPKVNVASYFLHKFIALGNFTELKTTTVFPSPRISDRVPFGTGKAVGELVRHSEPHKTYNLLTFIDLSIFFQHIKSIYQNPLEWTKLPLPDSVKQYLELHNFTEKLTEIIGNTSNFSAFEKRFYHWFNAFQVMKFAHFARDHFYPDMCVRKAAVQLLEKYGNTDILLDAKSLLKRFRHMDKE